MISDSRGKQPWWFSEANREEKCDASLAWETLRRTKSYPAMWRKCHRERAAFTGDPKKPRGIEILRLLNLFACVKEATSELCFKFVLDGLDPNLSWLELTDKQRLTFKGVAFGEGKPTRVNPAPLLPRQSVMPVFAVSIDLCELGRDSAGQMVILKPMRTELQHVMRCPFFRELDLDPGRYLCVYFDTTLTRDTLLAALEAEPQLWTPDPDSGSSRLKSGVVHVIPSDTPPIAIFIVPATSDAIRLRAAFCTKLKVTQRKKWHPRCIAHWKSLQIIDQIPRLRPDGTIEIDENGLPVRETIIRNLFNPEMDLPSARKATKSAGRADPWLGLAANDIVHQGKSLFRSSEAECLLTHCKGRRPNRRFKTDNKDYRRRRQDRQDRRYELRNHQKSAEKRLKELDRIFGRLDKKLDQCIKTNSGPG